jgi:methenyltetrahydromethanopterin cyclohydrolase
MISVNDSVTKYVDKLLDREEELGIKSNYLENKAMVIDCGVNSPGSIEAGILYSMISLGGLGNVTVVPGIIDNYYINFVQAIIDRPAIACLCSQKPAWKFKADGFAGTGYGPARAISQKPKNIFTAINYSDDSEIAVINIETQALPGTKELDYVARQCSTDPECVVALIARPNSIVNSIVNSTRVVEWAMNRLFQLGYDVKDIASASSVCPVSPLKKEESDFLGASFDSIAYYGMAYFYVKSRDDKFKDITSLSSRSYGKSFKTLLKESQGDFSKVDAAMYAPARILVNGMQDGSLEVYGKLDPLMLLESQGLKRN